MLRSAPLFGGMTTCRGKLLKQSRARAALATRFSGTARRSGLALRSETFSVLRYCAPAPRPGDKCIPAWALLTGGLGKVRI